MEEFIDILAPDSQEEGTESVIGSWLKSVGDTIQKDEPLLEISTDKVMVEIAAPASGVLKEILKEENDPVEPGMLLGRIAPAEATQKREPTPLKNPVSKPKPQQSVSTEGLKLSPAVRRVIEKHKLDPQAIPGTGRGGRITHDDVMAFLGNESPAKTKKSGPQSGKSSASGPSTRRVHTPMRRSIARHMAESMQTAPHVTAVFEANFSALIADRNSKKDEFSKKGVKLTFTPYIVQACCKALQAVPEVNSRYHDDALELFEHCNIGLGVALEDGLIVPVLREAEKLDLFETARQVQELTTRARDGKLEPSELQDGTFTISNHGMAGSLIATPIIYQPQSAILGVGKLEKRAVVKETSGKDEIVIQPTAFVTLTIDHRALDGFTANAFMRIFVESLEKEPQAERPEAAGS